MEGGGGGLFHMESAAPEAQTVLWIEAGITSWASRPRLSAPERCCCCATVRIPLPKSSVSFMCGLRGERTPGRKSGSIWGLRCGLCYYCYYLQVQRSSSETPVETYKSHGPSMPWLPLRLLQVETACHRHLLLCISGDSYGGTLVST